MIGQLTGTNDQYYMAMFKNYDSSHYQRVLLIVSNDSNGHSLSVLSQDFPIIGIYIFLYLYISYIVYIIHAY